MEQITKETEEKTGFIANIGKSVSKFAAKTSETIVQTVDKNGDGKFDRSDVGLSDENLQAVKDRVGKIAGAANQGIKNTSEKWNKSRADSKLEKERNALRPVFADEISQNCLPNMLRIVKMDNRRKSSEACIGSVGYWESVKGIDTLCIFEEFAPELGVTFHPNQSQGVFYIEPYQENLFVVLDDYFNYIKKARVNELEIIAQKLGAKRVQISFNEYSDSSIARNTKANLTISKEKASANYSNKGHTCVGVEIAADLQFSGHDHPETPELIYFKNESDIEKLIEMRLSNAENKIQSKTYRFQCSKSSQIKKDEAANIDVVAKSLKCGASQSFSDEIKRESRTELEYKIEF